MRRMRWRCCENSRARTPAADKASVCGNAAAFSAVGATGPRKARRDVAARNEGQQSRWQGVALTATKISHAALHRRGRQQLSQLSRQAAQNGLNLKFTNQRTTAGNKCTKRGVYSAVVGSDRVVLVTVAAANPYHVRVQAPECMRYNASRWCTTGSEDPRHATSRCAAEGVIKRLNPHNGCYMG